MTIYTLQIHNDNGLEFDKVYSCEKFQDIVNEYNKELNHYKKIGCIIKAKEEPTLDECDNEAHGMFLFENADGSHTSARVYDDFVME